MPSEQASEEPEMRLAPLSLVVAVSLELQAWKVASHKGPYMMGAVMMGVQGTGY